MENVISVIKAYENRIEEYRVYVNQNLYKIFPKLEEAEDYVNQFALEKAVYPEENNWKIEYAVS